MLHDDFCQKSLLAGLLKYIQLVDIHIHDIDDKLVIKLIEISIKH